MSFTNYTRRRMEVGLASGIAATEVEQAIGGRPGTCWYVDTWQGSDTNTGKSWREPFDTMSKALTSAATMDTIYFKGDVREQLTGSNIIYDITIIGVGARHHPDDLLTEDYGASMWRMPASGGSETTPLLIVRGRGWRFHNIFFDGPDTAAAVQLVRTAEGASEYDASHAEFHNCRFTSGQNHIEDNGGVGNIIIEGCEFRGATAFSILNVSGAAIAYPLNWKIIGNYFMPDDGSAAGNAGHIDCPFNCCVIKDNVFGTVTSTGRYIDLDGGTDPNMIVGNYFAGVYATDDYRKAVAGDMWIGNWCTAAATTAPNGFTILVPA